MAPFGASRIELKLSEIERYLYNRDRDTEKCPEPLELQLFAPWVPSQPELTPEECFDKIDREIFGL